MKKQLKRRDPVARAVAELGGLPGGGRHRNRVLDVRRGTRRRDKHPSSDAAD